MARVGGRLYMNVACTQSNFFAGSLLNFHWRLKNQSLVASKVADVMKKNSPSVFTINIVILFHHVCLSLNEIDGC